METTKQRPFCEVTLLGFHVTSDPAVLDSFLRETHELYQALQNALKPIHAAITDLEQDWMPRSQEFWTSFIQKLTPVRKSQQALLARFSPLWSREHGPTPWIIAATATGYVMDLRRLTHRIDDVGILITAYSAVYRSLQEKHLRQRHAILAALRELDEIGQGVVQQGRSDLAKAPAEQAAHNRPRNDRK